MTKELFNLLAVDTPTSVGELQVLRHLDQIKDRNDVNNVAFFRTIIRPFSVDLLRRPRLAYRVVDFLLFFCEGLRKEGNMKGLKKVIEVLTCEQVFPYASQTYDQLAASSAEKPIKAKSPSLKLLAELLVASHSPLDSMNVVNLALMCANELPRDELHMSKNAMDLLFKMAGSENLLALFPFEPKLFHELDYEGVKLARVVPLLPTPELAVFHLCRVDSHPDLPRAIFSHCSDPKFHGNIVELAGRFPNIALEVAKDKSSLAEAVSEAVKSLKKANPLDVEEAAWRPNVISLLEAAVNWEGIHCDDNAALTDDHPLQIQCLLSLVDTVASPTTLNSLLEFFTTTSAPLYKLLLARCLDSCPHALSLWARATSTQSPATLAALQTHLALAPEVLGPMLCATVRVDARAVLSSTSMLPDQSGILARLLPTTPWGYSMLCNLSPYLPVDGAALLQHIGDEPRHTEDLLALARAMSRDAAPGDCETRAQGDGTVSVLRHALSLDADAVLKQLAGFPRSVLHALEQDLLALLPRVEAVQLCALLYDCTGGIKAAFGVDPLVMTPRVEDRDEEARGVDKQRRRAVTQADFLKQSTLLSKLARGEEEITRPARTNSSSVSDSQNMVRTPQTIKNVALVRGNRDPVLLEGPTGAGKSFIVEMAALEEGVKLVRFNQSSRIEIDDFFGKLVFDGDEVTFKPGPFTEAFSKGYWLLLDELNLAPDAVLQTIESALGTHVVHIPDHTRGLPRPVTKHPQFRLFATQNPSNKGLYKGKREKLSDSFLSHWVSIVFDELPREDLQTIVRAQLPPQLQHFAPTMIEFFFKLRVKLDEQRSVTAEQELSLRDLLSWARRVALDAAPIAFEAAGVFGRCSLPLVTKLLASFGWSCNEDNLSEFELTPDVFKIGYAQCARRRVVMDDDLMEHAARRSCEDAARVHARVFALLTSKDFVTRFGLYPISDSWLKVWIDTFSGNLEDGVALYVGKIRHPIASTLVAQCFTPDDCSVTSAPFIANADWSFERPFVFTPRVLRAMKEILSVLRSSDTRTPLLLLSPPGAGKSALVRAVARIFGYGVESVCLTSESEPQALLGEMEPCGTRVEWRNGPVVRAAENGRWVLVDNLEQAEPAVTERLNPVLETPPIIVLTELGDHNKLRVHPAFRVFATMIDEGMSCLSPALANRFTLVKLDNLSRTKDDFEEEIRMVVEVYGGGMDPDATVEVCWLLWNLPAATRENVITFRTVTNFINSIASMMAAGRSYVASLWVAAELVMGMVAVDKRDTARAVIQQIVKEPYHVDKVTSDELVMTPSRQRIAASILQAVTCEFPVLLEGPAAVGKTTMVEDLAKANGRTVERVNNTESTTITDYFGSWIPEGSRFVFQKGALRRAIENGSWFLADEFNLCPPPIMGLLGPLLEGQRTLSVGLGPVVEVHPDFRFFATQNHASYTGRYKLPIVLRNRFLELQVEDFVESEIQTIIVQRGSVSEADATLLAKVYCALRPKITLRDVLKWVNRRTILSWTWPDLIHVFLDARETSVLETIFKGWKRPGNLTVKVEQTDVGVQFSQGDCHIMVKNARLDRSALFKRRQPQTFLKALMKVAIAAAAEEPMVLVGPTNCKSLVTETWCQIIDAERTTVYLSPGTETGDLLGQITPFARKAAIAEAVQLGRRLLRQPRPRYLVPFEAAVQAILRRLEALAEGRVEDVKEDVLQNNNKQLWQFPDRPSPRLGRMETEIGGDTAALGRSRSSSSDSDSAWDVMMEPDEKTNSNEQPTEDGFQDVSTRSVSSDGLGALPEDDGDPPPSECLQRDINNVGRHDDDPDVPPQTPVDAQAQLVRDLICNLLDLQCSGMLIRRLEKIRDALTNAHTSLIFLFRDGPVPRCATAGDVLVLEDIDLPPQACTERLNSLLEHPRSLRLAEDLTADCPTICIEPSFCVFTTMHTDGTARFPLSAALRSRLTEINVNGYGEEEVRMAVENVLAAALPVDEKPRAEELGRNLCMLLALMDTDVQVHRLFRAVDFLTKALGSVSVEERIVQAARFCILEVAAYPLEVALKWWAQIGHHDDSLIHSICGPPQSAGFFAQPKAENGWIRMAYTNIAVPCSFPDDVIVPTPRAAPCATFVKNCARVFACIASDASLLLEGPPGTGKTCVVMETARLLNVHCERINFSASITSEQLFGCLVGRCVDGQQVFEWQDGVLVSALRKQSWILLDEINLAPATILDAVAPVLVRHAAIFRIPVSNECIPLQNPTILATMNPKGAGGGRVRLPRSLANLFLTVTLEEYNADELRLICDHLFSPTDGPNLVSPEQLTRIFDFHQEIQAEAKKTLGQLGALCEFNLRDLVKVRDAILGNASDLMHHFRFYRPSGLDNCGIWMVCLRRFVSLVYKERFQTHSSRAMVQQLIDKHLPTHSEIEEDRSMDDSTPGCVRIGAVYLSTGTVETEPGRTTSALVKTPGTVEKLEILASAVCSKRAVLLEGPACTAKSSLVRELSTLAKRRLLEVTLHQDTEVGDLLGQLRVKSKKNYHAELQSEIELTCESLRAHVFLHITPKASDNLDAATSLADLHDLCVAGRKLENRMAIFERIARRHSEDFEWQRTALETLTRLQNEWARICHADDNDTLQFEFIEAPLVSAIRRGDWILLRNLNMAPAEIMERLNSLLEETPTLNLYEAAKNEVLRVSDGSIHSDTRIFATTNPDRVGAQKLSSPTRSRLMQVWVNSVEDKLAIAQTTLADIHGGDELAWLAIQFDSYVRELVARGTVDVMDGFALTFRNLERALMEVVWGSSHGVVPTSSLARGLLVYAQSMSRVEDRRRAIEHLANLFHDEAILKPKYRIRGRPEAGAQGTTLRNETSALRELVREAVSLMMNCIPENNATDLRCLQFFVRVETPDNSDVRNTMEDVLHRVVDTVDHVHSLIVPFFEDASFNDAQERLKVVREVVCEVKYMIEVCASEVLDVVEQDAEASKLRRGVRHALQQLVMLEKQEEALKQLDLPDLAKRFFDAAGMQNGRSPAFHLSQELSKPFLKAWENIGNVKETLKGMLVALNELNEFYAALQGAHLFWTVKCNTPSYYSWPLSKETLTTKEQLLGWERDLCADSVIERLDRIQEMHWLLPTLTPLQLDILRNHGFSHDSWGVADQVCAMRLMLDDQLKERTGVFTSFLYDNAEIRRGLKEAEEMEAVLQKREVKMKELHVELARLFHCEELSIIDAAATDALINEHNKVLQLAWEWRRKQSRALSPEEIRDTEFESLLRTMIPDSRQHDFGLLWAALGFDDTFSALPPYVNVQLIRHSAINERFNVSMSKPMEIFFLADFSSLSVAVFDCPRRAMTHFGFADCNTHRDACIRLASLCAFNCDKEPKFCGIHEPTATACLRAIAEYFQRGNDDDTIHAEEWRKKIFRLMPMRDRKRPKFITVRDVVECLRTNGDGPQDYAMMMTRCATKMLCIPKSNTKQELRDAVPKSAMPHFHFHQMVQKMAQRQQLRLSLSVLKEESPVHFAFRECHAALLLCKKCNDVAKFVAIFCARAPSTAKQSIDACKELQALLLRFLHGIQFADDGKLSVKAATWPPWRESQDLCNKMYSELGMGPEMVEKNDMHKTFLSDALTPLLPLDVLMCRESASSPCVAFESGLNPSPNFRESIRECRYKAEKLLKRSREECLQREQNIVRALRTLLVTLEDLDPTEERGVHIARNELNKLEEALEQYLVVQRREEPNFPQLADLRWVERTLPVDWSSATVPIDDAPKLEHVRSLRTMCSNMRSLDENTHIDSAKTLRCYGDLASTTRAWLQVSALSRTPNERFRDLASILSDELAIEIERNKHATDFSHQVHKEFARFRSMTLFEHKHKLANFDELRFVSNMSRVDVDVVSNLLRVFPEAARIMENRLHLDENSPNSVPMASLVCSVLELRISDIFSLTTPQLPEIISLAEAVQRREMSDASTLSDFVVVEGNNCDVFSFVSSHGRKLFGARFGEKAAQIILQIADNCPALDTSQHGLLQANVALQIWVATVLLAICRAAVVAIEEQNESPAVRTDQLTPEMRDVDQNIKDNQHALMTTTSDLHDVQRDLRQLISNLKDSVEELRKLDLELEANSYRSRNITELGDSRRNAIHKIDSIRRKITNCSDEMANLKQRLAQLEQEDERLHEMQNENRVKLGHDVRRLFIKRFDMLFHDAWLPKEGRTASPYDTLCAGLQRAAEICNQSLSGTLPVARGLEETFLRLSGALQKEMANWLQENDLFAQGARWILDMCHVATITLERCSALRCHGFLIELEEVNMVFESTTKLLDDTVSGSAPEIVSDIAENVSTQAFTMKALAMRRCNEVTKVCLENTGDFLLEVVLMCCLYVSEHQFCPQLFEFLIARLDAATSASIPSTEVFDRLQVLQNQLPTWADAYSTLAVSEVLGFSANPFQVSRELDKSRTLLGETHLSSSYIAHWLLSHLCTIFGDSDKECLGRYTDTEVCTGIDLLEAFDALARTRGSLMDSSIAEDFCNVSQVFLNSITTRGHRELAKELERLINALFTELFKAEISQKNSTIVQYVSHDLPTDRQKNGFRFLNEGGTILCPGSVFFGDLRPKVYENLEVALRSESEVYCADDLLQGRYAALLLEAWLFNSAHLVDLFTCSPTAIQILPRAHSDLFDKAVTLFQTSIDDVDYVPLLQEMYEKEEQIFDAYTQAFWHECGRVDLNDTLKLLKKLCATGQEAVVRFREEATKLVDARSEARRGLARKVYDDLWQLFTERNQKQKKVDDERKKLECILNTCIVISHKLNASDAMLRATRLIQIADKEKHKYKLKVPHVEAYFAIVEETYHVEMTMDHFDQRDEEVFDAIVISPWYYVGSVSSWIIPIRDLKDNPHTNFFYRYDFPFQMYVSRTKKNDTCWHREVGKIQMETVRNKNVNSESERLLLIFQHGTEIQITVHYRENIKRVADTCSLTVDDLDGKESEATLREQLHVKIHDGYHIIDLLKAHESSFGNSSSDSMESREEFERKHSSNANTKADEEALGVSFHGRTAKKCAQMFEKLMAAPALTCLMHSPEFTMIDIVQSGTSCLQELAIDQIELNGIKEPREVTLANPYHKDSIIDVWHSAFRDAFHCIVTVSEDIQAVLESIKKQLLRTIDLALCGSGSQITSAEDFGAHKRQRSETEKYFNQAKGMHTSLAYVTSISQRKSQCLTNLSRSNELAETKSCSGTSIDSLLQAMAALPVSKTVVRIIVSNDTLSEEHILVDFGVVPAQTAKQVGRSVIIENLRNERLRVFVESEGDEQLLKIMPSSYLTIPPRGSRTISCTLHCNYDSQICKLAATLSFGNSLVARLDVRAVLQAPVVCFNRESLDFGTVAIENTHAFETLTVKNPTALPMLLKAALSGRGRVDPPCMTLPPDSEGHIKVHLNVEVDGQVEERLTVGVCSNKCIRHFPVLAWIEKPSFSVLHRNVACVHLDKIKFPEVDIGLSSEERLEVRNDGKAPFTFKIQLPDDSIFSASPTKAKVRPGMSYVVCVKASNIPRGENIAYLTFFICKELFNLTCIARAGRPVLEMVPALVKFHMNCMKREELFDGDGIKSVSLKNIALKNAGDVSVEVSMPTQQLRMDPSSIILEPKMKKDIVLTYYPTSLIPIKSTFLFNTVPNIDARFNFEMDLKQAKMEIAQAILDFGVIQCDAEVAVFCAIKNSGTCILECKVSIARDDESLLSLAMFGEKRGKKKEIAEFQQFDIPASKGIQIRIEAKAGSKVGDFSGKLVVQSLNDFDIGADGKIQPTEFSVVLLGEVHDAASTVSVTNSVTLFEKALAPLSLPMLQRALSATSNFEQGTIAAEIVRMQFCNMDTPFGDFSTEEGTWKDGWTAASRLLPDNLRRMMDKVLAVGMETAGTLLMIGHNMQVVSAFQASLRRLESVYPTERVRPPTILRNAVTFLRHVLLPESPALLEAESLLRFLKTRGSVVDLLRYGSRRAKALAATLDRSNDDADGYCWGPLIPELLEPVDAALIDDLLSNKPARVVHRLSQVLEAGRAESRTQAVACALRLIAENRADTPDTVEVLVRVAFYAFDDANSVCDALLRFVPDAKKVKRKRFISALGQLVHVFIIKSSDAPNFENMWNTFIADFAVWGGKTDDEIREKLRLDASGPETARQLVKEIEDKNIEASLMECVRLYAHIERDNDVELPSLEAAAALICTTLHKLESAEPADVLEGASNLVSLRFQSEYLDTFVLAAQRFQTVPHIAINYLLRSAWCLAGLPPLDVSFPFSLEHAFGFLKDTSTPVVRGLPMALSELDKAVEFRDRLVALQRCPHKWLQATLSLMEELDYLLPQQLALEQTPPVAFRRNADIICAASRLLNAAREGHETHYSAVPMGIVYVLQAFCGFAVSPVQQARTFQIPALLGLAEIFVSGKGIPTQPDSSLQILTSESNAVLSRTHASESDEALVAMRNIDAMSGEPEPEVAGDISPAASADCSSSHPVGSALSRNSETQGNENVFKHDSADKMPMDSGMEVKAEEENVDRSDVAAHLPLGGCEVEENGSNAGIDKSGSVINLMADILDVEEDDDDNTGIEKNERAEESSPSVFDLMEDPLEVDEYANRSQSRSGFDEVEDDSAISSVGTSNFDDYNSDRDECEHGGTRTTGNWIFFPNDVRVQIPDVRDVPEQCPVNVEAFLRTVDRLTNQFDAARIGLKADIFSNATLKKDVVSVADIVAALPKLQATLELASSAFRDACRLAKFDVRHDALRAVAMRVLECAVNGFRLAVAVTLRARRFGPVNVLPEREELGRYLALLPRSVLGSIAKDIFTDDKEELDDFELHDPALVAAARGAISAAPFKRAFLPEKSLEVTFHESRDDASDASSLWSLEECDFSNLEIITDHPTDIDSPDDVVTRIADGGVVRDVIELDATCAPRVCTEGGFHATRIRSREEKFARGATVTGAFTSDEEKRVQRVKGVFDFQVSKKQIRDHLAMCNLADQYEKAKPSKKERTVGFVADPLEEIDTAPVDKWTYQMLVESPSLARISNHVYHEVRGVFETLYEKTRQMPSFEFCLLFDNSGSMIRLSNQVSEALVLLIETLRKLECRVAVARFGDRTGQKLLKSFDQRFSNTLGEQILNSFTYDESTHLVSGVEAVAHKLWPRGLENNASPPVNRVMLLMTDGLSRELYADNFQELLEDKKFSHFAVLSIREKGYENNSHLRNVDALLQDVTKGLYTTLYYPDDADALTTLIGELMKKVFSHATMNCVTSGEDNVQLLPVSDIRAPMHVFSMSQETVGFRISYPNQPIPLSARAMPPATTITPYVPVLHSINEHVVKKAELIWAQAARDAGPMVEDFVDALECIAPVNQYTRRRRDVKGSQLDPQGLMKHVATKGSYKKYFSTKTGGGRRNYSFTVLLDVSLSMGNLLSTGARETLVCLLEALHKLSLDFAVVCFGDHIRVVKTLDDNWSSQRVTQLLSEMHSDALRSNDAHAILGALELMSHTHGAKKIFVLTDGFGSCGMGLAEALVEARMQDVDVVAMAVGEEKSYVPYCYQRWIQAACPADVPNALHALYQRDEARAQAEEPQWVNRIPLGPSTEAVWANPGSKFPDLSAFLRGEREAKLVKGGGRSHSLSVDLCFCVDTTGSMGPWLNASKTQIRSIVTGIGPRVEREFSGMSISVRFAFVPYKDFCDGDHLAAHTIQPFTDDVGQIEAHVQTLHADGGGDAPEDVVGGIDAALRLDWQSTARILVLIADAPSHGAEFNDYGPGGDQHAPRLAGSDVMERARETAHLMFCRINEAETRKMERRFKEYYDAGSGNYSMESIDLFDASKQPLDSVVRVFGEKMTEIVCNKIMFDYF